MLFNSYEFILLFLPVTVTVFYLLGSFGQPRMALAWLVGASFFFYSWWNPIYIGLIIVSILFNYSFGMALSKGNRLHDKTVLSIGIIGNLGLLGYFKYTNFFIDNINFFTGTHFEIATIILPLGISFFTFQQIAYLVDAYQNKAHEYNFLHYCLFVSFFPQLISGPIVHHREMIPQFMHRSTYRLSHSNISVGVTLFVIGLFKKTFIADGIALSSTPVFDAAFQGTTLTFLESWFGAFAFTLQIYFDFSGYTDMAIGIGRMFGIRLPLNFHSPYKAENIIDFWRRWHITLARFMRDYIYIPLGGSRRGQTRRFLNILVTMLLCGLWHGSGWTYIIFGGIHGIYMIVNYLWINVLEFFNLTFHKTTWWRKGPARFLTFSAHAISLVVFRSENITTAVSFIRSMLGINGLYLDTPFINEILKDPLDTTVWFVCLFIIIWGMPNSQQIMARYRPSMKSLKEPLRRFQWRPTWQWALLTIVLAALSLNEMEKISEFLYFQF